MNGYKTKIRGSQESRGMNKTCGDTVASSIEVPRKVLLLLGGTRGTSLSLEATKNGDLGKSVTALRWSTGEPSSGRAGN